jgi:hypothetical protein
MYSKILRHCALIGLIITAAACLPDGNRIKGSRKVITQDRPASTFERIDVSSGLELYISPGDVHTIKVVADDNLVPYIKTAVHGNTLKISKQNATFTAFESMKVYVTLPKLTGLEVSSGASAKSVKTLLTADLSITSSSGSSVTLDVEADQLQCATSSGSNATLTGKSLSAKFSGSSGSTIQALNLMSNRVQAKASSGSTVKVYALSELYAEASSGASIRYRGAPRTIKGDKGSGGSLEQD